MKYKKIGDVCTILSGYAFDSKQFSNDPRDFPLIRIRDIVRGRTETYTKEKFDEKYIVKKGEFLIGMDGEFNIAPWNSQEALLNQRVCKIWCSSDEVIDNYLLYFLPKALKDIESKTSFVTVKHLSVKGINQIGIPLPPLEIQQRIAAILDTAAALLKLRQQQLAELEALIQSVFYQMFGDINSNTMKWKERPVNELCSEIVDCVNRTAPICDRKTPYKMIRTSNIQNGKINTLNVNCVEKDIYEKWIRRLKPERGDVLFTREAPLGNVGIVDTDESIFLGQRVMHYRPNMRLLNSWYFMMYLMSNDITRQVNSLSIGSTVKHLSVDDCKKFRIKVPPLSLQTQFAAIVQKIDQQKALVQQSIDETQTLFDSLMSQYFD
ncbi:restriction endonuclease subunit S [Acetobacterium malicum]|uniref:restriction endonuclease subunit S n=1 Tax=Acetobacterium malicum TaxID=52692 RepID=UPI0035930B6C